MYSLHILVFGLWFIFFFRVLCFGFSLWKFWIDIEVNITSFHANVNISKFEQYVLYYLFVTILFA